ncbi:hypothetical protein MTO96_050498 [Rhipicephalus appendiculatus]
MADSPKSARAYAPTTDTAAVSRGSQRSTPTNFERKSPPTLHMQAGSNIKVQSPVQYSNERLDQNQNLSMPSEPQFSPCPQVPPSFDSDELPEESNDIEQFYHPQSWQLLWMICSVAFITILIPMGIFFNVVVDRTNICSVRADILKR